jgi:uncharacterized NAD(P)/FAD-binding protein YdhS
LVRVCAGPADESAADEHTPAVAIVGGGCAGTLVAANLLRQAGGPLRVVLVERSGRFGPGVAYSTQDPQHRLNVPAQGMSAFCEEPSHFVQWAASRLGASSSPDSYLPRGVYGEYLQEVLAESRARARPGRTLELISGEVIGVTRPGARLELLLGDGSRVPCDRVVLATGSLEAAPMSLLPSDPRIITDVWAPGAIHAIKAAQGGPGGTAGVTLVVGTGLSAIDAALSTCSQQGRVLAVSRGGKLPHAHLPGLRTPAPAPVIPRETATLAQLERLVSEHVRSMQGLGYDWRDAIDGLRGDTPRMWAILPVSERRRFLRERVRAWETRRHRMAPAVAERVRSLLGDGRVQVQAGSLLAARSSAAGVEVDIRPSSQSHRARTLTFARVVVCTGAGTDVRRSTNPVLQTLLADGSVSPDPLGLGLQTTEEGALLDSHGRADGRLLTLGSLRRGELWETTAVPEIRAQAQSLANTIEQSLSRSRSGASRDGLSSQHPDDPLHLTARPSIWTVATEARP